MEMTIIGLVGLVVLIVLMCLSVPIGFCFAVVGFSGLVYVLGLAPALAMMKTVAYFQVANYTWTVFPLFMLMGEIAGEGGLTGDAFDSAKKWVGHLRGGLALATTVASTLFAAVCGSMMASSVTMTKVAWPEMKKNKYDPSLSLGSILCASGISSLIPPSIPFVVYGMLADESVGRLFIGGIIPGVILAVTIVATVYLWILINPKVAPAAERASWKERIKSIKSVWSVFLLILLIMGGLWGGIFTANEAAGIGCSGALLISLFKKRLKWASLKRSLRDSAIVTSSMFVLIIAVQIFNSFLTVTNLPTMLAQWVVSLSLPTTVVMIFVLIIYLILGIPLELGPVFLLTVPIFVPLLSSLGIDKVWFGILTTITSGIAAMTPPVGAPMFLMHNVVRKDGISLNTIFKGAWIFCIPCMVTLIICIIFPELSTWLPGTMFGK